MYLWKNKSDNLIEIWSASQISKNYHKYYGKSRYFRIYFTVAPQIQMIIFKKSLIIILSKESEKILIY